MQPLTMKYNPAFLSEQQLVDSFVVREADLALLVGVVKENTESSNQHALVFGPRGIGKTTLLLRVVADIARTPALAEKWHPIVFGEESYGVTTPGEFWLEAIFQLAQKLDDPGWQRLHAELNEEPDETRLRERALAQLLDFADGQNKRLLLVVENLDMLLGSQISTDDAWKIRHTLLNEPRVMLLGSAASRLDMLENADQAFFEAFRLHDLKPLDTQECAKVWSAVTGNPVAESHIRPIEILTGGNPRLITIIASFAGHLSLRELMTDLTRLVDEHTEYFKSHIDGLAPVERKVYLALAELWSQSTAREVAEAARLDVNKTSALLKRLVERGAVVVEGSRNSKRLYRLAERMYNIYYLMRRRGSPSSRVQAAVQFMIGFYGPERMMDVSRCIADEALASRVGERREHYLAFDALLDRVGRTRLREEIIGSAPIEFLEAADAPAHFRELAEKRRKDAHLETEFARAEHWAQQALEKTPDNPIFQHTLASLLCAQGKGAEALAVTAECLTSREFVEQFVEDATGIIVGLAAIDHGPQALDLVRNSPSADLLEPLIVGLQLFLCEEPQAPLEIIEVGKDVAERIEKRKTELVSRERTNDKRDTPNSSKKSPTETQG